MKTILIFTFMFNVYCSIIGQIAYTSAHLPITEQVIEAHVGYPGSSEGIITPPGSNPQVWDFTEVIESPNYVVQTFQAPEGLPGFEHFPNATSAYQFWLSDSAAFSQVVFFQKTDSGLYKHGQYLALYNEQNITSTSIETYIGYPEIPANFSYGWGHNELIRTDGSYLSYNPNNPLAHRIISYRDISFECDAWGTLHTPVYPDGVEVLRLKTQYGSQIIDSSFVDTTHTGLGDWILVSVDTSIVQNIDPHYRFMQCDSLNPVVAQAGLNQGMMQLAYFGSIPTNVAEYNLRDLLVYPNPVTMETFNIEFDQRLAATVIISTISGKKLFERDIRGESKVTLSAHNLPSGMLIIQVFDRNGALQASGKLVNGR